jgi:hypothetical protein
MQQMHAGPMSTHSPGQWARSGRPNEVTTIVAALLLWMQSHRYRGGCEVLEWRPETVYAHLRLATLVRRHIAGRGEQRSETHERPGDGAEWRAGAGCKPYLTEGSTCMALHDA